MHIISRTTYPMLDVPSSNLVKLEVSQSVEEINCHCYYMVKAEACLAALVELVT